MKKIVVIIPSYKNSQWCQKNVESVLSQDYPNFRVLYTDDASPDDTVDKVSQVVDKYDAWDKFTLIQNDVRKGAMHNIYNMVHSCQDDEIVVTTDGDDWFTHNKSLQIIGKEYRKDIWMTYGSYQDVPQNTRGCCKPYSQLEINQNKFRYVPWRASHPRSFLVSLFKKIPKKEFYDPQGNFLDMAWDLAFMLPMLEMSGPRHAYIHDIIYDYNGMNPIQDHKVNQGRQAQMDRWIRSKPRFNRVDSL